MAAGTGNGTGNGASEPFLNDPGGGPSGPGAGPGAGQRASTAGSPTFDTSVAHQSRVYDYLLGGKDNYEADRRAAEVAIASYPGVVYTMRANRAFLGRVVRYLAGEAGIRQFLDIGTGIPTAGNTHQVAQEVAPECRVVYVDYDPIVLAHARALLTSTQEGRTDYLDADVRDPESVLAGAAQTLDFSRPVAVTMLALLHVMGDGDNPHRIVSTIMGAMAPGSYLALTHGASDIEPEKVTDGLSRFNQASYQQYTFRGRAGVLRFFDGLDMVEPGLVQVHQWRAGAVPDRTTPMWCGVGRKPGPAQGR